MKHSQEVIIKIRESRGYLHDEIRKRDDYIETILKEKEETKKEIDDLSEVIKQKDKVIDEKNA